MKRYEDLDTTFFADSEEDEYFCSRCAKRLAEVATEYALVPHAFTKDMIYGYILMAIELKDMGLITEKFMAGFIRILDYETYIKYFYDQRMIEKDNATV